MCAGLTVCVGVAIRSEAIVKSLTYLGSEGGLNSTHKRDRVPEPVEDRDEGRGDPFESYGVGRGGFVESMGDL